MKIATWIFMLPFCLELNAKVIGNTDPTATFTYSFPLSCEDATIQFTNTSSSLSGTLILTIWDFGDGTGSTVYAPAHTYASAGNYTVTLTIQNSNGDYAVTSQIITVHPNPQVNFEVTGTDRCVSAVQNFDNLSSIPSNDLTYFWDFGDGSTSSDEEPQHQFLSAGDYEVILTATSATVGCNASISKIITIYPEVNVDFSADFVCQGLATSFINESGQIDGYITWLWDFGDGQNSSQENPTHQYATSGDYLVELQATTNHGCITSFSRTISVYEQPVSAFEVNSGCFAVDAVFTNTSSHADSYLWYFGDGVTSTGENPSHLYARYGSYTISLVSSNSSGCKDSLSQVIQIYPLPSTGFTVENVCLGDVSQFTNTSQITSGTLSYLWDFGDGTTSAAINPSHTYSAQGDYEVVLTATSESGCATQYQELVGVYAQPEAGFTVADICADSAAIFINTTTGSVLTYEWSFGDGTTSTAASPTHAYSSAGTYQVTLSVVSGSGCSDSHSETVHIKPLPVISFVVESVCDTVTMPFSNLSSISSGTLSYTWDFGDGSGSSLTEPSHLYPSYGIYAVTLTGRSDGGCVTSLTKSTTVYARPEAGFVTAAVCDGSPASFTNSSVLPLGSIVSYRWDFGDGTNSIVQNPEKEYLNEGTYTVMLEVESDHTCTDAYEHEVTVYEFPSADFTVENVCTGFPVYPENDSYISTGDLIYSWDFGDASISDQYEPSHTYASPGVYTITLTATSGTGCADVIQKDVRIYELPDADAGIDVTVSQGFDVQLEASGGVAYSWSPLDYLSNSDIYNPVATPLETITYQVLVTDSYGCENTDEVTITVEDDFKLIVSNVLTPDDNGINDYWKIENVETFGTAHVRVYDRYGVLVFQDKAYQNDWKGTRGKDILPDGTYYYLITFSNSSQEYQGAVTILRNK